MSSTHPPPKKAPREFWLRFRRPFESMRVEGFCNKPDADSIHTIEITALTRLQAQLAEAKEALEFYADPKTYESKREREIKIGDYFAWECSFPIKEDHDGDKARAALAAISEEKD